MQNLKSRKIDEKDRSILRRLSEKVRAIADGRENKEKQELWFRLNSLRSEKPIVLTSPEGAWGELIPDNELECEVQMSRRWEFHLKSRIMHHEFIKDDRAIDPWFDINWYINTGSFGFDIKQTQGEHRGSYTWDAPIKNIKDDLERLIYRTILINREQTMEEVEEARNAFGDILPVRIRGSFFWTMGLTWDLIRLIGLENLMLFMYDDPDNLHKLMAWKRDEQMNFISFFEKNDLLSLNNTGDIIASGGLGYTSELPAKDFAGHVRLKDLWGFAESQETVGVSPSMFAEFIFPYQKPLLDKFGLNCYGCCEPVDKRLDTILTIPRLKRISISPWADEKICAGRMGRNYIYSRKPNPAYICAEFNEGAVREDIRNTLKYAGNLNLEIIMKDTHTVQNDRTRIPRWVKIAREEIDKSGNF